MRRAQHFGGHEPEPPWLLAWLSVTYRVLPPQVKFLLWVLTYTLVRVTGLMPSIPRMSSWF
jgi:hypothetical protein